MSPEMVNGIGEAGWRSLAAATWQGGVAAIAVWTICRWVRVSPRMRAWLWWAVSARMLLGLLPLGTVPLRILPAEPSTSPSALEDDRNVRLTATVPFVSQEHRYIQDP